MAKKMDKFSLENQLCFKLYALSRQVTGLYRPLLEELDITYPQYLVFLLLWEEKSMTVKEIGQRLYLDSGTLTPLLKRLDQKKMITRQRDGDDERSVIITITTIGKDLKSKAKRIPDVLLKCIPISEGDHELLKAQLDKTLSYLPVNRNN